MDESTKHSDRMVTKGFSYNEMDIITRLEVKTTRAHPEVRIRFLVQICE